MIWHRSLPEVCGCYVLLRENKGSALMLWGNSGIALTALRKRSRNKAAGLQLLDEPPQVLGGLGPVLGRRNGLLNGYEAPLHYAKLGVGLGESEQRLPHASCRVQTFAEEKLKGSMRGRRIDQLGVPQC